MILYSTTILLSVDLRVERSLRIYSANKVAGGHNRGRGTNFLCMNFLVQQEAKEKLSPIRIGLTTYFSNIHANNTGYFVFPLLLLWCVFQGKSNPITQNNTKIRG